MADENLHETDELGDKEDKSENEETKQGVAGNFAGDVTIEDAHEAKGECNMGGWPRRCRGHRGEETRKKWRVRSGAEGRVQRARRVGRQDAGVEILRAKGALRMTGIKCGGDGADRE